MFDLTHLLISPALAQDAAPDTQGAAPPAGILSVVSPQMLVMAAIFCVFYFIVIRPQQKKLDEQTKMIKALQRGDRIVTNGGLHGKIVRLEGDDQVIIEIADGVQVKHERGQIQSLAARTQPVAPSETAAK